MVARSYRYSWPGFWSLYTDTTIFEPSWVALEKFTIWPGNDAASDWYSSASGWASSVRVTFGAPAAVSTPMTVSMSAAMI